MFCGNENYLPKPKAYPIIYLPEFASYTLLNNNCPYIFEYPNYTQIVPDTFFFEEEILSKCWINMVYPTLNAKVHFSYKEIGRDISLEDVIQDSYDLAFTHTKKADFIDQIEIENEYGAKGLLTNIGGNTANNVQFYVTDNSKHYLRGALYFKSHPNVDSLQPAIDFIYKDVTHLLESFRWK